MSLDTALEHLRRFRATFNDGEPVDEESGLTADHLTAIICAVEAFGEDVVAGDPWPGRGISAPGNEVIGNTGDGPDGFPGAPKEFRLARYVCGRRPA
jgi:hypothetical protein